MTDYLIHFNSNHSPRNGQFIRGDGDNDGIVDDHGHRRKGDREYVSSSRRKDRVYRERPTHKDVVTSSSRNRTYKERESISGKTVRIGDTKGYVSRPSRNITFKERVSIPGKITTVGNREFVKSNSGKSSNVNSAYTSKGSNYVTSVKNVSVRKLVNDEEDKDKKNQSGYNPMDHRHREPSTYDYMHYNPYQTRSYQTAEDKHQHYVDAVEKGLTNNKSTYTDKYKKTTTR